MQLTTSIVAGIIAASMVAAAPVEAPKKVVSVPMSRRAGGSLKHPDGKVNFQAVDQHLAGLRAKYSRNLKAVQKNTGKPHPLASKSATAPAKRGVGNNPLTSQENNALWTGPISFGGQQMTVDFDTGSADCLVGPGAYSPGYSAQDTGKQFSTSYGDGTTASGEVYLDTLSIAGLSADSAAIGLAQQTFLQSGENSDGICGMSLPALATFDQPPYFYSLKNAGAVDSGVFAFALSSGSSTLTLGGLDSDLYSGDVVYSGLSSSQGFWQISGTGAGYSSDGFIIDSGTSLIVAPVNVAEQMFSNLGANPTTQQGTTYGSYDCNNPPNVEFEFGGKTISLTSSAVTIGANGDGTCLLSIVGQDIGIDGVVTGDPLFESSYIAFNTDDNSVGFADRT
ncbi:hypothetical protein OC846_004329 [Tilletia horrida]|uniref:Peptidase A1 domain-containing protein n=1 Tax=Tilletia horrida TaxID=155126 RepID=A0AAN6GNH1_9BASI|nr:hypothetical protein OC846_004329 [Tilletia horrida]KAK0565881.1 hypothetical protein OC861_003542 [Tilletia horrida]